MAEWLRHGECNGCGACCRVLAKPVTLSLRLPMEAREPAYLLARGLYAQEGMATVTGAFVAPCPQLRETPEGATRCVLHDSAAFPRYCADYPTRPEQIAAFPCSYYFTRDGEAWGGQASPFPVRTREAA